MREKKKRTPREREIKGKEEKAESKEVGTITPSGFCF